MAESLPKNETVTIEDLVLSQAFEISALITILEKKGILNQQEILDEIKRMRDKSQVRVP
jgi:uncharacterized protein YjgD (DUF1641 family)